MRHRYLDARFAFFIDEALGIGDIDVERAVNPGIRRRSVDCGSGDPPWGVKLVHSKKNKRIPKRGRQNAQ